MPRFQILPAEAKFFDWFEKSAATMHEAAEQLFELVNKFEHVENRVGRITELEHNGDFIVHEVVELLNRTFVLPLDREDIHNLIGRLDDVLDYIEAAADSLLLYKIERPTPIARELARVIVEASREVQRAMPMLRENKLLANLRPIAVEINRLENEGDRLLRTGIAELLERPDQLFDLIRWKAIYEQLEQATDALEDVADILQAVAMKHG